jgi:hypothetical protein
VTKTLCRKWTLHASAYEEHWYERTLHASAYEEHWYERTLHASAYEAHWCERTLWCEWRCRKVQR